VDGYQSFQGTKYTGHDTQCGGDKTSDGKMCYNVNGPKIPQIKRPKVGCLHPVARIRSGSGFPSNATLV
jgi:hypothetical protein